MPGLEVACLSGSAGSTYAVAISVGNTLAVVQGHGDKH